VESHFCNFNSNTTLYFVFIFIKIIFFIIYFNFFSLSSFFFSLSFSIFFTVLPCNPYHGKPTANPRQPIQRQTHGNPRGNPLQPIPRQPTATHYPRREPKPPSTHTHAENPSHRQPIPTPRTQATVNPENGNPENPSHQKMSTPRQRERTEKMSTPSHHTETQTHEQTETQPHRQPNPTVNPTPPSTQAHQKICYDGGEEREKKGRNEMERRKKGLYRLFRK
jgi:hypothetical protein